MNNKGVISTTKIDDKGSSIGTDVDPCLASTGEDVFCLGKGIAMSRRKSSSKASSVLSTNKIDNKGSSIGTDEIVTPCLKSTGEDVSCLGTGTALSRKKSSSKDCPSNSNQTLLNTVEKLALQMQKKASKQKKEDTVKQLTATNLLNPENVCSPLVHKSRIKANSSFYEGLDEEECQNLTVQFIKKEQKDNSTSSLSHISSTSHQSKKLNKKTLARQPGRRKSASKKVISKEISIKPLSRNLVSNLQSTEKFVRSADEVSNLLIQISSNTDQNKAVSFRKTNNSVSSVCSMVEEHNQGLFPIYKSQKIISCTSSSNVQEVSNTSQISRNTKKEAKSEKYATKSSPSNQCKKNFKLNALRGRKRKGKSLFSNIRRGSTSITLKTSAIDTSDEVDFKTKLRKNVVFSSKSEAKTKRSASLTLCKDACKYAPNKEKDMESDHKTISKLKRRNTFNSSLDPIISATKKVSKSVSASFKKNEIKVKTEPIDYDDVTDNIVSNINALPYEGSSENDFDSQNDFAPSSSQESKACSLKMRFKMKSITTRNNERHFYVIDKISDSEEELNELQEPSESVEKSQYELNMSEKQPFVKKEVKVKNYTNNTYDEEITSVNKPLKKLRVSGLSKLNSRFKSPLKISFDTQQDEISHSFHQTTTETITSKSGSSNQFSKNDHFESSLIKRKGSSTFENCDVQNEVQSVNLNATPIPVNATAPMKPNTNANPKPKVSKGKVLEHVRKVLSTSDSCNEKELPKRNVNVSNKLKISKGKILKHQDDSFGDSNGDDMFEYHVKTISEIDGKSSIISNFSETNKNLLLPENLGACSQRDTNLSNNKIGIKLSMKEDVQVATPTNFLPLKQKSKRGRKPKISKCSASKHQVTVLKDSVNNDEGDILGEDSIVTEKSHTSGLHLRTKKKLSLKNQSNFSTKTRSLRKRSFTSCFTKGKILKHQNGSFSDSNGSDIFEYRVKRIGEMDNKSSIISNFSKTNKNLLLPENLAEGAHKDTNFPNNKIGMKLTTNEDVRDVVQSSSLQLRQKSKRGRKPKISKCNISKHDATFSHKSEKHENLAEDSNGYEISQTGDIHLRTKNRLSLKNRSSVSTETKCSRENSFTSLNSNIPKDNTQDMISEKALTIPLDRFENSEAKSKNKTKMTLSKSKISADEIVLLKEVNSSQSVDQEHYDETTANFSSVRKDCDLKMKFKLTRKNTVDQDPVSISLKRSLISRRRKLRSKLLSRAKQNYNSNSIDCITIDSDDDLKNANSDCNYNSAACNAQIIKHDSNSDTVNIKQTWKYTRNNDTGSVNRKKVKHISDKIVNSKERGKHDHIADNLNTSQNVEYDHNNKITSNMQKERRDHSNDTVNTWENVKHNCDDTAIVKYNERIDCDDAANIKKTEKQNKNRDVTKDKKNAKSHNDAVNNKKNTVQDLLDEFSKICRPCKVKIYRLSSSEIQKRTTSNATLDDSKNAKSCSLLLSSTLNILDSEFHSESPLTECGSAADASKEAEDHFTFPTACNSPFKTKFDASPATNLECDNSPDSRNWANSTTVHANRVKLKNQRKILFREDKKLSDILASGDREDMDVLWNLSYFSPIRGNSVPNSPPSCFSPVLSARNFEEPKESPCGTSVALSSERGNEIKMDIVEKAFSRMKPPCSHHSKEHKNFVSSRDNILCSDDSSSSSVDESENRHCFDKVADIYQTRTEAESENIFKSSENKLSQTVEDICDSDSEKETHPGVRILDFQDCLIESDSDVNPLLNLDYSFTSPPKESQCDKRLYPLLYDQSLANPSQNFENRFYDNIFDSSANDVFKSADDVFKSADDVFKSTDDVFKSTDDVFKSTDDVFKSTDDIFESMDPIMPIVQKYDSDISNIPGISDFMMAKHGELFEPSKWGSNSQLCLSQEDHDMVYTNKVEVEMPSKNFDFCVNQEVSDCTPMYNTPLPSVVKEVNVPINHSSNILASEDLLQSCSITSTSELDTKHKTLDLIGNSNGEDILSMIVKSCNISEEFDESLNSIGDICEETSFNKTDICKDLLETCDGNDNKPFSLHSSYLKRSFCENTEDVVSSSVKSNYDEELSIGNSMINATDNLQEKEMLDILKISPDQNENKDGLPLNDKHTDFKFGHNLDECFLFDDVVYSFYTDETMCGLSQYMSSTLGLESQKQTTELSHGIEDSKEVLPKICADSKIRAPVNLEENFSVQEAHTTVANSPATSQVEKIMTDANIDSLPVSNSYTITPVVHPPTFIEVEQWLTHSKGEEDSGSETNAASRTSEESLSSTDSHSSDNPGIKDSQENALLNSFPSLSNVEILNTNSDMLREALLSKKHPSFELTPSAISPGYLHAVSESASHKMSSTPLSFHKGSLKRKFGAQKVFKLESSASANVQKESQCYLQNAALSPIVSKNPIVTERKRRLSFGESESPGKKQKLQSHLLKLNRFQNEKISLQESMDCTLQNVSSSEIDGPSYENSRNFKVNDGNLGDARVSHEAQHLTMMSLEIHVNTRNDLRPDPKFDTVEAIFFCIYNDERLDNQEEIIGIIAVNDSSSKQNGNSNERFCAMLKNNLLLTPGIKNVSSYCVESELMLFAKLADIVKEWDPDILIGYEIQMSSLGYLAERAAFLDIDLSVSLSRIVEQKDFKRGQYVVEDHTVIDQTADLLNKMNITGRIVLNVWRLMRKEVTLNVYTFENVYYHVLHKRTPSYTYQDLTKWYQGLQKERVIHYYALRARGSMQLLEKLDVIRRTSELARLFGIQFYEVLSRGSQFRVESMMLRNALPLDYIPVSPSVRQRSHSRAPECIPLILEPESRFYTDPVLVLDFQSLYPSMIIAYNYCYSTCLGRVDHFGKNVPFDFGCTSLNVPTNLLQKLNKDIHMSPTGIAFVKSSVRRGILPIMLEEILNTRIMVKQAIKRTNANPALKKLLDARQLGLKLIANVTYGYTSANFSGRMPNVEVADSIVGKARETLERAIHLVENSPRWNAKVVYGDTDSMFVLLPGRSKEQAFKIGEEIADAVTASNPKPVKLKFEKVYLPCVLQTKKRYVGYMYETLDQKKPVYDAKGIETVRRDSCPATAKILEKSLKLLFDTYNVSSVKKYVQSQFSKLLSGRSNIIDCIFAKEYRGIPGYRPGACVPALEISKKRLLKDPRSEPRVGERVPYVVVYGFPGLPIIQLVREPPELLQDPNLRINAKYYITRVISPPLERVFSLIGADVKSWYTSLARTFVPTLPVMRPTNQSRGTLSQYFATLSCAACDKPTQSSVCDACQNDLQVTTVVLQDKVRQWERTWDHLHQVCNSCTKASNCAESCSSIDCPVLFRFHQATRDLSQAPYLRRLVAHELF